MPKILQYINDLTKNRINCSRKNIIDSSTNNTVKTFNNEITQNPKAINLIKSAKNIVFISDKNKDIKSNLNYIVRPDLNSNNNILLQAIIFLLEMMEYVMKKIKTSLKLRIQM